MVGMKYHYAPKYKIIISQIILRDLILLKDACLGSITGEAYNLNNKQVAVIVVILLVNNTQAKTQDTDVTVYK